MGDEYDAAETTYLNGEWNEEVDTFMGDEYDDTPQPRSFVNPRGLSRAQQATQNERDFGTIYPLIPVISVQRDGIQWPTHDERQNMRTSDELRTEAENLRLQAERLEEIAAQRAKYGEDPFKNGTVLKIDMKYRDTARTYAYGAVKTAGRYWLSGRLIPQNGVITASINTGWTWEQFVAWLAQGDATVWQAMSLRQVL
jgi:hypothetical protein